MSEWVLLGAGLLIFASAALYSSVGHGGGSGYLAVMALFSVSPAVMRPTALVLNIVVATVALVTFARQGAFSWRVLWPFAIAASPMAFLGGRLDVPGIAYKPLLAAILLYSAVLLLRPRGVEPAGLDAVPPIVPAVGVGAGIGLLSGITGIGGGIFFSPVVLFKGWAHPKTTSGVAAAFILLNSLAGLVGQLSIVAQIPFMAISVWAPAALAGGFLGSRLGSRTARPTNIYRALAVVLVMAAIKMLLTFDG